MEKIKEFLASEKGKDILIVIIVILVGLGSFELGRLSKASQSSGITISQPANVISTLNDNVSKSVSSTPVNKDKNFFASSKGSKYYPIGCSAGKTIIQENRVYFATKESAEQAGYELSASCK